MVHFDLSLRMRDPNVMWLKPFHNHQIFFSLQSILRTIYVLGRCLFENKVARLKT